MINELEVYHFRNLAAQKIIFAPGLNLLCGKNGQGKTNLLEAIFYLLTGKSYRVQRESELIRWGENSFRLSGRFVIADRTIVLESTYLNKSKGITVNGLPCRKLSDFIGLINVVFFSPDDLAIVKGSPGKRRRFIDAHIIQIKPSYVRVLNAYNRVLAQKSSLLRQNASAKEKNRQLDMWNEELVHYGAEIYLKREEFLTQINQETVDIYQAISLTAEGMELVYRPLGFVDAATAVEEFAILLQKKKELEIERRMILLGPHRDTFEIYLNRNNSRLFASQGQQRSLVLALKLAQLEIIKQSRGITPLLLLDDVFSELDKYRRKYLIDFVRSSDIQTIMTNAIEEDDPLAGEVYNVKDGIIHQ
jgi:DNA replication and repair protein RecF